MFVTVDSLIDVSKYKKIDYALFVMGGSFHHTYLLRRPYRTIPNIKTAIIKAKTITAIMYEFSVSFRSKK